MKHSLNRVIELCCYRPK